MTAQVDVQQIREVLSSTPGYESAEFDIPTRTMVLSTASQDGGADLLRALSRAGYPATEASVVREQARPG